MSKHTPGPWFHHGPSGSQHTAGGFINSTPERNGSPLVCSIYGNDGQPHEFNAALISNSPKLLLALEDALVLIKEISEHVPSMKQRAEAYQNLIEKAKGQ